MKELHKLLVLVLLLEQKNNYDLEDIRNNIGISVRDFYKLMDEMFDEDLVEYRENLLSISFKGRMMLATNDMDSFLEHSGIEDELFNERWPIDKPYYVRKFSQKKWRDS